MTIITNKTSFTCKPLSLEYKDQGVRKLLTDQGLMYFDGKLKLWQPIKVAKTTKTKTPKK